MSNHKDSWLWALNTMSTTSEARDYERTTGFIFNVNRKPRYFGQKYCDICMLSPFMFHSEAKDQLLNRCLYCFLDHFFFVRIHCNWFCNEVLGVRPPHNPKNNQVWPETAADLMIVFLEAVKGLGIVKILKFQLVISTPIINFYNILKIRFTE